MTSGESFLPGESHWLLGMNDWGVMTGGVTHSYDTGTLLIVRKQTEACACFVVITSFAVMPHVNCRLAFQHVFHDKPSVIVKLVHSPRM